MALRALTRRELLGWAITGGLQAQPPIEWVCPMDPDVRASKPEKCGKCGMALVAGLPSPDEYVVKIQMTPAAARAGQAIALRFRISHPRSGKPADLDLIHEKLLHLFMISKDLSVFRHVHPELQPDGSFLHRTILAKAGMYRVLCDFYPRHATPQMIAKTLFLRDQAPASKILPEITPSNSENLKVRLRTEPAIPLAGLKTMLFFEVSPTEGLEPYLGAWGHLLAASSDLIDLMHAHPAWEAGGPTIQFNLIFPRPGVHRVWVQFQRLGIVNTAAFTLDVRSV